MKTDAQVQQDVMSELQWEPSVHAERIGVEVKDGVVTLAGHVGSFSEKWNAEQAAQRVAGVRALAVEIEVALEGDNKRSDADIARSAENVLQWMTYLTNHRLKVMVENGWITLTGEVSWGYQRLAAAVHHLMGVRGVSDQIGITPQVLPGAVKSVIEDALKRRAKADAPQVSVEVSGNDVTLGGTVHSWSEWDLATQAAWGSAGVNRVINNIAIR